MASKQEEKDRHTCSACGARPATKRCGGCKSVWYCDQKCQIFHWPNHRRVCNEIGQQRKQKDEKRKQQQEQQKRLALFYAKQFFMECNKETTSAMQIIEQVEVKLGVSFHISKKKEILEYLKELSKEGENSHEEDPHLCPCCQARSQEHEQQSQNDGATSRSISSRDPPSSHVGFDGGGTVDPPGRSEAAPPKKEEKPNNTSAPPKKQEKPNNTSKPRCLALPPEPTTNARTSLGYKAPDMKELAELMHQDVVLHIHTRSLEPYILDAFEDVFGYMGVYEPFTTDNNNNGFPVFKLDSSKTNWLKNKFAACSKKSRDSLSKLGINFETSDGKRHPAILYRLKLNDGSFGWKVEDTSSTVGPGGPAGLISFDSEQMARELNLWTERGGLYLRSEAHFMPWYDIRLYMENDYTSLDIAVTPLNRFLEAIEIAEAQRENLDKMADDFRFWNKPLILLCGCNSNKALKQIERYTGVYLPDNRTFQGYPVWRLSDQRSEALVELTSKEGRLGLEAFGVQLPRCKNRESAVLYMYRHVPHIAHPECFDSDPAHEYSLRLFDVNHQDERLLTESDALFQLGKAACAQWAIGVNDMWYGVKIALTLEESYKRTLDLIDLEAHLAGESPKLEQGSIISEELNEDNEEKPKKAKPKKRRSNRKKKKAENSKPPSDKSASHNDGTDLPKEFGSHDDAAKATAKRFYDRMAKKLGVESNMSDKPAGSDDKTFGTETVRAFFDPNIEAPFFLMIDEAQARTIYEACLAAETSVVCDTDKTWLRSCASEVLLRCIEQGWKQFALSVLQTREPISSNALLQIFEKLPAKRHDDWNNRFGRGVTAIQLVSSNDFSPLLAAVTKCVGKSTKRDFLRVLKESQSQLDKAKQSAKKDRERTSKAPVEEKKKHDAPKSLTEGKKQPEVEAEDATATKTGDVNDMKRRVGISINWYRDLLNQYSVGIGLDEKGAYEAETLIQLDDYAGDLANQGDGSMVNEDTTKLSSKDIAAAMAKCIKLSEEDQAGIISNVERSMDLKDWEDDSEWTVEMTEQAHKWFQRHKKRQHYLCDRVIRRLKILSTGRWPYVLCKPVRTSKSSSVKLYESKIDKSCRIIWEVAISFSPRRSKPNFSCCEQVIRLWDVVQDHDNLTRSIDLAVERIERSHMRGRQCLIFSELENFDCNVDLNFSTDSSGQRLPRVFAMRQGVDANKDDLVVQKSRHYPPASEDPQQFTLLKFYELDAGAINLLLDGQTDNPDLPFTPGPKEHEIIHFSSEPKRSILLMGRSGTGKTTCLVFRMWAQFMAYEAEGAKPRQLFVTKNDVLRKEVEKSFGNMGLAWRKKSHSAPSVEDVVTGNQDKESDHPTNLKFPLFLTSSEWLDVLDNELPGERFFTGEEIEDRISRREDDDAVQRGVEALFAEEEKQAIIQSTGTARREMTFKVFCEKWRKINSKTKASLDPALVWLEIKSYIKGSIKALHIYMENQERSQRKNRFLELDEYLALPRKVSRLDEGQRRLVYELYEIYERVKREGNYFDEMDLVYNLAGRVSIFRSDLRTTEGSHKTSQSILPIDSLFVDEVQDFTAAELYLLTKLSRDPNNLMLAGDTAQSIAVGVGFRFTDVRQLFYEEFESIEPSLLQLTHNYRSHAGILRLAASVVELLYFFFSDSLDRLPPDLGLLDGPSPVIMEAQSSEDLVLMLEGSKRETSRIEFGAHQVVIVRSEEAKQALPDEFGVDKDWVMTVQESKGLEFDDVLLYNFFTDSEAGDMWRVVCNYKEEDIAEYYKGISVTSSGVFNYEWDGLLEAKSRHLDFSQEKHKLLESELKMLYTAITRARVNVFIAESDSGACLPMFEYFQRRQVVEVATTNLAGVRVFGKMSTIDDWRKRGNYYMRNAEGSGVKGRLRLAAKCFEKAGEVKRRDYALALLAFAEIEEETATATTKKGGKQAAIRRERLYTIAVQLLEAKDDALLNKAAYCLMRVGEDEYARSAEMFELYAMISYTKNVKNRNSQRSATTKHEQQYFSYAGKLFQKWASGQHVAASDRGTFYIKSFQNYLRSGRKEDVAMGLMMLDRKADVLHRSFKELVALCHPQGKALIDPISKHWQSENNAVQSSMKKLARLACRFYHADDDLMGMTTALNCIPTSEKIQVLMSLDTDPLDFISRTGWGSHPAYTKSYKSRRSLDDGKRKVVDVTTMLVDAYKKSGSYEKAAEVLEERGLLLEAAACLHDQIKDDCNEGTHHKLMCKIAELKAQYLNLVLQCNEWQYLQDDLKAVLSELEALKSILSPSPESIVSIALASAKISGEGQWDMLDKTEKFPLWKLESVMMIVSSEIGLEGLLSRRPNDGYWGNIGFVLSLAKALGEAAAALCKKASACNAGDLGLQAQVQSYFLLKRSKFNPDKLLTFSVTNIQLRCAFQSEGEDDLLSTKRLVIELDRDRLHSILGRYLYRQASKLLLLLEKHLAAQSDKLQPCVSLKSGTPCKYGTKCKHSHGSLWKTTIDHARALQARVFCLEQMLPLRRQIEEKFPGSSIGKSLHGWRKENCKVVAKNLAKYLLDVNHLHFKVVDDEYVEKEQDNDCIVWRKTTLRALTDHAHNHWHSLSLYQQEEKLDELLRYWRLLRFCDEKKNASSKVEAELQKVERKTKRKSKEAKKVDRFISSTDMRLFSHMWIWAVDTVNEDLFQAIALVEQLITRTNNLPGLSSLHKADQVDLLTTNAIGIFAALSLRYSASKQAQLLIPEKSYLNCHLKGKGSARSRGFGLPLQDVLVKAVEKHCFECFSTCLGHVECIAETILDGKLLQFPKVGTGQVEDYVRLERAIILGFFICANAALFAVAGSNITPQEAQQDPNQLPSLPLSGNIQKLLQKLRLTLLECKSSPGNINKFLQKLRLTAPECKSSPRLQEAYGNLGDSSNFSEVLQCTNTVLRNSGWDDKFVACRVKQASKIGVEVETLLNIAEVSSTLQSVPFHENSEIFLNSYKMNSGQFLSQFIGGSRSTANADIGFVSRKFEERKAATTILRYLKTFRQGSSFTARSEAVFFFSAKFHFHSWKRVMSGFIAIVKSRMGNILLEKEKSSASAIVGNPNPSVCPLNVLQDLTHDWHHHQRSVKKWSAMLESHSPVYDGIECSFCWQFPFPDARAARQQWCSFNLPNSTYRDASRQYNWMRFGTPEAPFEIRYDAISFQQHAYDGYHLANLNSWRSHKDAMTQVVISLDNAFLAVTGIINVCDSQHGHPYAASWYLNVGEQARMMLQDLENSQWRFFNEAMQWPPNPNTINMLVVALNDSSRKALDFFVNVREQELRTAEAHEAAKERLEGGEGQPTDDPLRVALP